MSNQKEICKILEIAANRCWKHGNGASSKQCWYLAGLMAAEGRDVTEATIFGSTAQPMLTKAEASRMIDSALFFAKARQNGMEAALKSKEA